MVAELDEAQLQREAERLARRLAPGTVVWLVGDLGAGKTTFAQALARGRGASGPVTSPTFALVHAYTTDGAGVSGAVVYHVDCYRLRSPDEAGEIDWASLSRGDLLIVEWPERGGAYVPPPAVEVRLAHVADPDHRRVEVSEMEPG